MVYMAAGAECNTDKPINKEDKTGGGAELFLADLFAFESGLPSVVIYQVPNCRMIFADDPEQRHKKEDELLAWSFKRFYDDP